MKTKTPKLIIGLAVSAMFALMLALYFQSETCKTKTNNVDSSETKHSHGENRALRRPPDDAVPVMPMIASSLSAALSEYFKVFHSFPTGGNLSVSAALKGDNPKRLAIINESNMWKGGLLMDVWNVPCEISISNGLLTLRSAGPNRKMGDSDDVIEMRDIKTDHPARP